MGGEGMGRVLWGRAHFSRSSKAVRSAMMAAQQSSISWAAHESMHSRSPQEHHIGGTAAGWAARSCTCDEAKDGRREQRRLHLRIHLHRTRVDFAVSKGTRKFPQPKAALRAPSLSDGFNVNSESEN